jgi:hypothetical protein
LWRLRRATAIESGLLKIQAKHLLLFRQRRQDHQEPPKIIDSMYRNGFAEEEIQQDQEMPISAFDPPAPVGAEPASRPVRSTTSILSPIADVLTKGSSTDIQIATSTSCCPGPTAIKALKGRGRE